jgi:DNA polymerase III alpha subunit
LAKYYRFPCGCQWPLLGEPPSHDELPLLDFDVEKAPTDCPATWGLLGKGLTKGVFQLESSLGKTWTKRLKPESLEHVAALGALLRPGCLRAGTRFLQPRVHCLTTELLDPLDEDGSSCKDLRAG